MPKSGSGKDGARGNIPDGKLVRVKILNERKATSGVIRAYVAYKLQAAEQFPELKGQIYSDLKKITVADISGADGLYVPSQKKIVIASRILKNAERTKEVTAHELGHAFTERTKRGFENYKDAFDKAYKQYAKTNKGATERSFAQSISSYAATAKSEAFAEAFKDYSLHGKKASEASKLIMKYWRKK